MMCKHCGKQIKDVSRGVCTACGQAVMTGPTGNGFYDILTGNQGAVQSGSAGGAVRNDEEGFFVSNDLMTELINAQKTTNKYLKRQTEYKRMAIIISLVALVVTIALTISFILFSINFEGSEEGIPKPSDAPRETSDIRGGGGDNGGGRLIPSATPTATSTSTSTPPTPSAPIPIDDINLDDKPTTENSAIVKLDWIDEILEQLSGKLDSGKLSEKHDGQSYDTVIARAQQEKDNENWNDAAEYYEKAFDMLKQHTGLLITGSDLETAVENVLNELTERED